MSDPDVLVLGAGISGLAAAVELRRRGRRVRVLERGQRPGGLIDTEERDGYLLEWGPSSFLGSACNVVALAAALDVEGCIVIADPASHRRYVFHDGQLHPVPMGPGALLKSRLFSTRGKLRILGEPFVGDRAQGGETVSEFFQRRFGREVLDRLVAPFVSGVWSGDPDELEMRAAFPQVVELVRGRGSVIGGRLRQLFRRRQRRAEGPPARATCSFRGGFATLTRAAAELLGDDLKLGVTVERIERDAGGWQVHGHAAGRRCRHRAPALVVAVGAHAAATLVETLDPELARLIAAVPCSEIGVVQVGIAVEALPRPLDGFGFLVARPVSLPILGAIWVSSIFPFRAPEGRALLSVYLGGRTQPAAAGLSEAQLGTRAVEGLGQALGGTLEPELVVARWIAPAIPQYVRGHTRRVAALRQQTAEHDRLCLAGNYLDGVSVDRAIGSGLAAAAACAAMDAD